MILCSQLVEAVRYLQKEVGIIHNDLKGDNVLITKLPVVMTASDFQIVVVDFGKATKISDGKKYSLSFSEKLKFHPHLAPELIDGIVRQSTFTDMFSLGKLFLKVSTLDVILQSNKPCVSQFN